jgi:NitT/TauT family transport system substrate-binding protein
VIEIASIKKVADFEGTIDAASFERGQKVWFREMTGIKPLTMAEIVSPTFVEAARKAYPG